MTYQGHVVSVRVVGGEMQVSLSHPVNMQLSQKLYTNHITTVALWGSSNPGNQYTWVTRGHRPFLHGKLTFSIGNGGTVTFAFTLLHRWGPNSFWTVTRCLSSVGETLHSPHLLAKATMSGTLNPKTRTETKY